MESKFKFDQSYGRVLGQAYMSIFKRLSKLMKDANLPITPDQFRVLTHLWQNDGCPQQELANSSNRDRANVTRILDILEREGIVMRKNHESDRRVYRIYLTEYGKSLEEKAAKCAKKSIEDALAGIKKSDVEICLSVLKKTIQNLK